MELKKGIKELWPNILTVTYTIVGIWLAVAFFKFMFSSEPNDFEIVVDMSEWTFQDSVYNYIEELNIKHPDVVFRQAVLESGNFKSKVFKDNNNMFGFKQAFKRANTQTGVNRGYATYSSWQECVIDYALYQTYSMKDATRDEYINFLGRHYAEDPQYKQKIK